MLTPGSRIGAYEIASSLGAGGMGEVYRATDLNLKRQVAIKVLPASVAGDPDRLARFQREAEVLASLNHPHIAAIHGLEKASDVTALVMELIEGEDLSQRIARGPIPLDDALPIARQIADALDAAHDRGIIHRDLKPANIKVRADGTVKVLDFGLAKTLDGSGGSGGSGRSADDVLNSPTITTPAMTHAGMILGTAAYMAPEQAKGLAVDKRADIWAFGAVLFEILTGKRAFAGDDVSEVLASVLAREPDWPSLPATLPPSIIVCIKRCLQRDPRLRWRDIGDVRLALDGAFDVPARQPAAPAVVQARSQRLAWAVAAIAVMSAAALAVPAMRSLRAGPTRTLGVVNLTLGVAPAQRLGPVSFFARPSRTAFAIAPDGGTIVFAGDVLAPDSPSTTMLYRRPLADLQAVAIPGTERAEYPFFSPDGQWVGFAAAGKLKKVALSGGPPIDICDLPARIGGASWGPSGVIVFSLLSRGLLMVSSDGGKAEQLLEAPDRSLLFSPQALPDGHTVLFTESFSAGSGEQARVDAIDVATKERRQLLTNAADARYSPTGHLIFMRNAALLAAPFDIARVAITGAPVPLLAGVMHSINAPNTSDETGMGQFALSASGTLVYAAGDRYPTAKSTLTRVDHKGYEVKVAESAGDVGGLRASASGSRVIGFQAGEGRRATDLWLYELPLGTATRLTTTGNAMWPLFSPDDKSVIYHSVAEGGTYLLPLAGGTPQLVADPKVAVLVASWSRDGKWLALLKFIDGVAQIFVSPVRDGKPDIDAARPFAPSTFAQRDAAFSPDGRWIAYVSNDSGAYEVYVQAFPGPGERHRISPNGGLNPAWAPTGRELYYLRRVGSPGLAPTHTMMAVDISTDGRFNAGVPRALFAAPHGGTVPLRSHDVLPNGDFIVNRGQVLPDQPITMLNVVLGWADVLKTRVAAVR